MEMRGNFVLFTVLRPLCGVAMSRVREHRWLNKIMTSVDLFQSCWWTTERYNWHLAYHDSCCHEATIQYQSVLEKKQRYIGSWSLLLDQPELFSYTEMTMSGGFHKVRPRPHRGGRRVPSKVDIVRELAWICGQGGGGLRIPKFCRHAPLVGRNFVCLLLELASWRTQPAELPTAKAKLATAGIFSEKSLPTTWWVAVYSPDAWLPNFGQ